MASFSRSKLGTILKLLHISIESTGLGENIYQHGLVKKVELGQTAGQIAAHR